MSEESRNAGSGLRDSEITESIIAAAIAAHCELGLGFLESVYEQHSRLNLLSVELPLFAKRPSRFSIATTKLESTV